MLTLDMEMVSRSTPSNLEGLSEVKSGIKKKNSPKYDKKRKSEKKLKYGEKKYLSIVNLQAVKLNFKKQCLLLLLLCVNDCQMIASHDFEFLVPHKTCICLLINMQSICCMVGYNAWVERLPFFAIFYQSRNVLVRIRTIN